VWAGPEAVRDTQEVYAAAQYYGEFLDYGMPVTFDVPKKPGAVISGLILKDHVLVRRTDFGGTHEPVEIMAGTKKITVPPVKGKCMILSLK